MRTGCAEGHVGVGCVETPALAWPSISVPLDVETRHVKAPDNAK